MKKFLLITISCFACIVDIQAQPLNVSTLKGGSCDQFGNSLNFDGADDYISVGEWFNEQLFTIEYWINPASTQNTYAMIVDNNHSYSIRWNTQQSGSNTNTYDFGVAVNDGDAIVSYTLTANVWQHAALVKASNFIAVYINGTRVAYMSCSGSIKGSGEDFIRIGQWAGGGRAWKGYIDEIRFWNDVRTPSEISDNMNSVITNPRSETNLIAYYQCNQGVADGNNSELTTVTDSSAYSHDATLVNFGLTGNTSNWVGLSPIPLKTYYADADADGFGNAAITILSCTPPSRYVSDSTDCNDANAAVHPGAEEVCNGIDDNCDEQIDEGCATSNHPVVSISIPDSIVKYKAPARIKINAVASDGNGKIAKVEFYSDTALLHTETLFPYGFLWVDVPVGKYQLQAKATDNDGNVSTSNYLIVAVGDESVPPLVSIVSPIYATTYYSTPGPVQLIAYATDPNATIRKVEFYDGTRLIRTENYYPYRYRWSIPKSGAHEITAKATNSNGLSTTSAPVTIILSPPSHLSVNSKKSREKSTPLTNDADDLKLIPNPASNTLQIFSNEFLQKKPSVISVLSATGVVMKIMKLNPATNLVTLDISSLQNGVYTIKVQVGNKNSYNQFVKMR